MNQKGCSRLAAASNKVYQLLARGRWFSPASFTTKTGRHDIKNTVGFTENSNDYYYFMGSTPPKATLHMYLE
jgi:hypothetical protein